MTFYLVTSLINCPHLSQFFCSSLHSLRLKNSWHLSLLGNDGDSAFPVPLLFKHFRVYYHTRHLHPGNTLSISTSFVSFRSPNPWQLCWREEDEILEDGPLINGSGWPSFPYVTLDLDSRKMCVCYLVFFSPCLFSCFYVDG